MEGYKESCLIPLEQVNKEMDGLSRRLTQTLMENFKTDVKVRKRAWTSEMLVISGALVKDRIESS